MTVRPAFINTGGTGDIGGRRREFNLYQMVYSGAGRRAAKIQDWTWDNNRGRQNAEYAYSWSASMHPGGTGLYQIRKPAFVRNLDYLNGQCALTWDDAGNLGQVSMGRPGEMFEKGRFLFWTEDSRMHAAVDDKYFSYYVYDHSGERRLKLTGDNKQLDVNADFMVTYTVLNEPTLYPSAYMVLTNKGYTKHYYVGTERVAARIGGGCLKTLEKSPKLQKAADSLFDQCLEQVNSRVLKENDLECIMRNRFAKEEFGHWIEGIPYQMKADVECDHRLFKEMVDSMLTDYHNGEEKEVYFYHSDHLGSASWITDFEGVAVQHLQYLPYGEPYIDQRAAGTTYRERFRFTGKEKDEETGYGYFGARYMDHELMSMWLSVDPMMEMSPNMSPYHYCHWNPIKLTDPTGMLDDEWQLNIRTNELTWVSGKGGALQQTITCITPDGSSFVHQTKGMLLRAESRWIGGNGYEVNIETRDCPQFFPPLAQIDGICVPLNSNRPSSSSVALTGAFIFGAASAVDNLPKNITVDNYIESYTNYCRTKFNMPNGRLSNAKIDELTSNYNSIKTFGKIGKWGGGALSVVGASSEIIYAANNHSTGAWIRAGISSGAAAAGILCSGPMAPFVAAGVLFWGIIDACWGDYIFDF